MISAETYLVYVAPALVATAGIVLLLAFQMLRARQARLFPEWVASTPGGARLSLDNEMAAAEAGPPGSSQENAAASRDPSAGSPSSTTNAQSVPTRLEPARTSASQRILVTGGAGFIGSALVRLLVQESPYRVLNLDKLTYAGSLSSLAAVAQDPRYEFVQADICDEAALAAIFRRFDPDIVAHLAAESHVDRSIDGPDAFIETNIVGTYRMLRAATAHWQALAPERRAQFRFHHISTDEVFGSLGPDGFFVEETPYDPRSPYSASKAGSDHLVRAWHHTYGLPTLVTNCSNNYGPYHFPEKLIPLVIIKALGGERLPVYGRGENVRDWLFVEDHVRALRRVFEAGTPGETYNVGGNSERTNLAVVEAICGLLDELRPRPDGRPYAEQIAFVADRPGHDLRYAIDATKLKTELGWEPQESFETGLRKTVAWYLANESWWRAIQAGQYGGERLGLKAAS